MCTESAAHGPLTNGVHAEPAFSTPKSGAAGINFSLRHAEASASTPAVTLCSPTAATENSLGLISTDLNQSAFFS